MKNAKNPSSQRPSAHLQVSCSPPWRPKEGCLSWEQFQHNQSRIRSNWQSTGEAGAPREGEGLLLCGQLELGDVLLGLRNASADLRKSFPLNEFSSRCRSRSEPALTRSRTPQHRLPVVT